MSAQTTAAVLSSWMVCAPCELAGGPYLPAEAHKLAGVHDQVHHGGRATAAATRYPVCESCRRSPAVLAWARPGAGAPFLLCAGCAPTDAVPTADAGVRVGER